MRQNKKTLMKYYENKIPSMDEGKPRYDNPPPMYLRIKWRREFLDKGLEYSMSYQKYLKQKTRQWEHNKNFKKASAHKR